jgi:HD-GYP domain-containing protein (c-di-GMP phosphodiesterase class II)
MAVADAYSAMTTDRPYRKGMQSVDARRILELGSGTQWDPTFVHVFLNQLSARPLSRIQDDGG